MTPERLRELIAAYGGDPMRWPASDRAAAGTVEADPALRQALMQARALDALIGQHAPALPALNMQQLVAVITATPQPRGFAVAGPAAGRRLFGGWPFAWPNVAALASIAVVGIIVGWTGLDASFGATEDEEAAGNNLFAVVEELPW